MGELLLWAIGTLWLLLVAAAFYLKSRKEREDEDGELTVGAGRHDTSSTANSSAKEAKAKTRLPTLRISYRDYEGNETLREVSPFTRATNERFRAWCHLRQQSREFLFDRIQGGIDLQTGEELTRAGVFKHIHPNRKVPEDLH